MLLYQIEKKEEKNDRKTDKSIYKIIVIIKLYKKKQDWNREKWRIIEIGNNL